MPTWHIVRWQNLVSFSDKEVMELPSDLVGRKEAPNSNLPFPASADLEDYRPEFESQVTKGAQEEAEVSISLLVSKHISF